jgi:uncharacterized protein
VGVTLLATGAGLFAPAVEELLFRGFVFGILRSRLRTAEAIVLASAIFAAFHGQPEVMLPIFLVGAVLNGIYVRTGSLAYPILFHLLFNGATLVWTGVG